MSVIDRLRVGLQSVQNKLREAEAGGLLLLVLMFAAITPMKIEITNLTVDPGIDGGFYTQVAQLVRDGHGLVSNFDWYHQGYPYFPYPTNIYPLWPLIYGYLGRLFPIVQGGAWFNCCLYYVSLTFAYLWARKAFPGQLLPSVPSMNAGHLFVLVLGLHERFFWFTSMVYTEAIAWTLVLILLWYSHDRWRQPSVRAGLVTGMLLGLIALSRYQLFLVTIAVVMAFGWGLLFTSPRRRLLVMTAATAAGFLLVVVPFLLYITPYLANGVTSVAPFGRGRATNLLSRFSPGMRGGTFSEVVADRFDGLMTVAFNPENKWGLWKVYGNFCYAVIAATFMLPFVAVRGLMRRRLGPAWRWLRQAENLPYVFAALLTFGGFFHLFLIHKSYSHPWYFARRQGLPSMFMVFGCLLFLFRARIPGAVVLAMFLTATGAQYTWNECRGAIEREQGRFNKTFPRADEGDMTSRYDKVAKWLEKKRDENGGKLNVVMGPAYRYSHRTTGVGYHGLMGATRVSDLKVMFDELDTDLLIVWKGSVKKQRKYRSKKFKALFKRTGETIGSYVVFARREPEEAG